MKEEKTCSKCKHFDGVVWEKEYEGFESTSDIERDISELWRDVDDNLPANFVIPGDFQGRMTITITYKGEIVTARRPDEEILL